jgi:dihydroxyacetone kinase
VSAAIDAVRSLGHAEVGDKTMLDALVPLHVALGDSAARGEELRSAWSAAAAVATRAARETSSLLPRVGRARPLAEKSVGTPDPGAVSLALIATSISGTTLEAGADK